MRDLSYLLGNLITRINSFSCNRHGLPWPLLVAADPWIHRAPSIQCTALRLGLIEMSKGGGAFVLCCRTDGPRHRDCLSVERLQINSIVDADAAADVFRFKRNGRQRRRGETIRRMWLAVAGIRYFSVENQWVNEFRAY